MFARNINVRGRNSWLSKAIAVVLRRSITDASEIFTSTGFLVKQAQSLTRKQNVRGAQSQESGRPKIITRIVGGIGNQLFCYAAARRLALVNNAELVIDDTSGFVDDHLYRRQYQLDHFMIPCRKVTRAERLEPFGRSRQRLLRVFNRRRPFAKRRYIQQEGFDFDSRLLRYVPRGTVYLDGYWQSERYFQDVKATIRSELRIRPPTDTANSAMAMRIRDTPSVAVHVRFFDGPDGARINNSPRDYYVRAVVHMEMHVPYAHYYLFSDRPDDARAWIPLPDDRVTTVSHNRGDANAFADLWLMAQCRHFIIANSTFSWWGAWLGEYGERRIIAPGFEMREGITAWGFEGLLPGEWIKL